MSIASRDESTFTPDRLVVCDEVLSDQITLLSGQNLARGAVVGKITASGKYKLSLSASTDGSEVPSRILAHDTDASGGDTLTPAYYNGDFDANAVILGTGHTVASVFEGLRSKGINLISTIRG